MVDAAAHIGLGLVGQDLRVVAAALDRHLAFPQVARYIGADPGLCVK